VNEHADQRRPQHKQNAKAPLQRSRGLTRPICSRKFQLAPSWQEFFAAFFKQEEDFFFEKKKQKTFAI
jgi:hypothetical protein